MSRVAAATGGNLNTAQFLQFVDGGERAEEGEGSKGKLEGAGGRSGGR